MKLIPTSNAVSCTPLPRRADAAAVRQPRAEDDLGDLQVAVAKLSQSHAGESMSPAPQGPPVTARSCLELGEQRLPVLFAERRADTLDREQLRGSRGRRRRTPRGRSRSRPCRRACPRPAPGARHAARRTGAGPPAPRPDRGGSCADPRAREGRDHVVAAGRSSAGESRIGVAHVTAAPSGERPGDRRSARGSAVGGSCPGRSCSARSSDRPPTPGSWRLGSPPGPPACFPAR